jgi:hypothetical protein
LSASGIEGGDGSDGIALRYSLGGALVVVVAGGLVALTLRRRQPSV